MSKVGEFLKTTAMGGLFVLLPVLLLYLLLAEALDLVIALATPIADLFPKGTFDQIKFPVLAALVLIVVVSFLIGLALRSSTGRRLGNRIERVTLRRLPLYNALKNMTKGLMQAGQDSFRPAFLVSSDGCREPAYIIEDHGNDRVTVLLPWAPAAFSGPVKIVRRDLLEVLDTNLGDFSKALSHWGIGFRELASKGRKGEFSGGSSQQRQPDR